MPRSVSLCLIVRNEQHNLAACIGEVRRLCQEVVVVDTGSTDSTRQVATDLGAKVFEFPWCDDFSAARNAMLDHATGDWIFWLDADDRLDGENLDRLRRLFENLPAQAPDQPEVYVMNCHCPAGTGIADFEIAHARLFPRRSGLRWRGRVHEALAYPMPPGIDDRMAYSRVVQTDIVIRHEGYRDPATVMNKQLRDLRLLRREYLLNPSDPLISFYLGRTLAVVERPVEAIYYLTRSIEADPNGRLITTPKAIVTVLHCHRKMGSLPDGVPLATDAARRFPNDFEIQYECGALFLDCRNLQNAEVCLRRVAFDDCPRDCRSGLPKSVHSAGAKRLLAQALSEQGGRAMEAADLARQAVAERPDDPQAWNLLGELAINAGRRDEVVAALNALASIPGTQVSCAILNALLAYSECRFADAARSATQVTMVAPGHSGGWLILARSRSAMKADPKSVAEAYAQAAALSLPAHAVAIRAEASARARLAAQVADAVPIESEAFAGARLVHAAAVRLGGAA